MTTSELGPLLGWQRKAPTRRLRLRALFAEGRWLTQQELQAATSHRFGATLQTIHKAHPSRPDVAKDGAPRVHYEMREGTSGESNYVYRKTDDVAQCHGCSAAYQKERLRQDNNALRAKVAALEAELRGRGP